MVASLPFLKKDKPIPAKDSKWQNNISMRMSVMSVK